MEVETAGTEAPDPQEDRRHHFVISVSVRGHGADWGMHVLPQDVRAWNLRAALRAAAELPFSAWFPSSGVAELPLFDVPPGGEGP